MKLTLILLTLMVLLAGCGSKGYWYRPDLTQDQFRKDNYQCDYEAQLLVSGVYPLWQIPIIRRHGHSVYRQCMEAQGYEWVEDQ